VTSSLSEITEWQEQELRRRRYRRRLLPVLEPHRPQEPRIQAPECGDARDASYGDAPRHRSSCSLWPLRDPQLPLHRWQPALRD